MSANGQQTDTLFNRRDIRKAVTTLARHARMCSARRAAAAAVVAAAGRPIGRCSCGARTGALARTPSRRAAPARQQWERVSSGWAERREAVLCVRLRGAGLGFHAMHAPVPAEKQPSLDSPPPRVSRSSRVRASWQRCWRASSAWAERRGAV
eukprot:scaffold5089_cov127-Isochrysis_galbana.AAC.6